jgi:hypothetical protein
MCVKLLFGLVKRQSMFEDRQQEEQNHKNKNAVSDD